MQMKTLSSQPSTVYSIGFSPDGKTIIIAGADISVRLINIQSGSEIRRYKGPEFAVYNVGFSPDGNTIFAGGVGLGENRNVYLWNVA